MLARLNRSRSLRGGRNTANNSASGTASVGASAGAASFSSFSSTSSANISTNTTNHVGGQGVAHGPNAPLSLLSTMVVPSAAPALVLNTASSSSDEMLSASTLSSVSSSAVAKSTTLSTASISSATSAGSSSSLTSSSNTATSSVSTPSIDPGLVSKPILQASTVLGLTQETQASPPSPGIDGKRECPYVNRPLPPPPPPKNSSTMPSRPGTSTSIGGKRLAAPSTASAGGALLALPSRTSDLNHRISRDDMFLGTQMKKNAAFDKRISRDDLYLGTRPPAAHSAIFHVPLRHQPPAEEEIFDLAMAPPLALPARMATPESVMSGEIQIGMALGSPVRSSPPEQLHPYRQRHQIQHERLQQSEPATYAAWQSSTGVDGSLPSSDLSSAPRTINKAPTMTSDAPMQRSKSTRRKLFGIFGSKRHNDHAKSALPSSSSAYSLDASESSSIMMTSAISSSTTVAKATNSKPGERPTTRGGGRKHQPIIIQIEPDLATKEQAKASNTLTDTQLPPDVTATSTKTVPSLRVTPSVREGRSMRPFLRSKASEPAFRKRPEISNPIPIALENSTMSNLDSMKTIPAGTGASGSYSHLMPRPMLGASPYLDVEIPEARMERYSVMFGGLIGSGQSWQPASSLLARRQATLDKLKTINDRMHQDDMDRDRENAAAADAFIGGQGLPIGGLIRRATSPHVAKSPAFSLFPSKPSSYSNNALAASSSPRSPRLRSNTTPAATQSPMRSDFDLLRPPFTAQGPAQQSQRHLNPLRENPTKIARRAPMIPHTMTTSTQTSTPVAQPLTQFDPSQSVLILESPTEMTSPGDDRETWKETTQQLQSFKPVIQEPQWQMIIPQSAGSNSSNGSSSNGSATSNLIRGKGQGITSSPSSATSVELDVDEPDSALKSAVEISIARQISISRRQRQLLRPIKTNKLAMPISKGAAAIAVEDATPVSSPSRSATLRLDRNERLQETKSSTPTLVVAPNAEDNYDFSNGSSNNDIPRPQHQHRQNMQYLSPRSNTAVNDNLQMYQMAQNRKSERVILEAA